MAPRRRIAAALSAVMLGVAMAALGGCGGGGGNSRSGPSITVKGTFGAGITLASRDTGVKRFLGWFAPQKAYAAVGTTIDNVIAADASGLVVLATKSGNGFTLSLPAGQVYLVAFLSGTTTKAIYRADPSGAGWSALPVTGGSHDVDLGTLAFDPAGVGTGSTPPATVAERLGVDAGVSSVIAVWDDAMQRLANVDVDGDGTFDFQQNRRYWFALHYEFDPMRSFTDIQGAFADKTATQYLGYGYFFSATPGGAHDWQGSTLTAPAPITPYGGTPSATTTTCFADAFGGAGVSVNFYCGASGGGGNIATAPMEPPAGGYTVTVDGSTTYRFENVASQTIDSNLYDVYIPAVKLTMAAGNKVASLDIQWWKKTAAGWSQPSAAELSAIMAYVGYELGRQGWNGSTAERVRGELAVAPNASATVPAQTNFDPGALRIEYRDAFGYIYGFDWR